MKWAFQMTKDPCAVQLDFFYISVSAYCLLTQHYLLLLFMKISIFTKKKKRQASLHINNITFLSSNKQISRIYYSQRSW